MIQKQLDWEHDANNIPQINKMNEEDYVITSEEDHVRTIGKASIPGKLVTKTNSHNHTKEVFIADKDFQNNGMSYNTTIERTINGMVYGVTKTTVYTPQGEADTYGTPRPLRLADSPVNDAEAEIAFDSMLKSSSVYSGLEEGSFYGTNTADTSGTVDKSSTRYGQIYINTGSGDIWIYVE